MADVSVRPARPSDAATIAAIQRDTLAMTYESALTPELMAQLNDPAAYEAAIAQIAELIAEARAHVLVALDGERTVGFVFAHAGSDGDDETSLQDTDDDPAHTAVIEQLLVEPRWGRRGHGSRLLAAVTDVLAGEGFTRVVTWAPELSAAGTGFLTSAGWAPDGYARGLDNGSGVVVRELRFHAALA